MRGRQDLIERFAAIGLEGEFLADRRHFFGINLSHHDRFLVAALIDDASQGIDQQGITWIFQVAPMTHSIDAEDIGLVFDGPCFHQIDPMKSSRDGPVGDD